MGFNLFGVLPGDNDCGGLNRMNITIGIVRVGVSDSKRRVDLGIYIDAFPFFMHAWAEIVAWLNVL